MQTIKEQMDTAIKGLKAIQKRIINLERKKYADEPEAALYSYYEAAFYCIEDAIQDIRDAKKRFKQGERE